MLQLHNCECMFDWQDVYSEIAFLVDKKRSEDAAKGNKIATVLNGYIQRKVKKLAFVNKLKSGTQNVNTRNHITMLLKNCFVTRLLAINFRAYLPLLFHLCYVYFIG